MFYSISYHIFCLLAYLEEPRLPFSGPERGFELHVQGVSTRVVQVPANVSYSNGTEY
jgi:hypothetical protein